MKCYQKIAMPAKVLITFLYLKYLEQEIRRADRVKIRRAASIPLVLHDPFFSIWSNADHLYDKDTVHWSGVQQKIRGYIQTDDMRYCFMGDAENHEVIPQKEVDVTATATEYTFENEKLSLRVRFTSPLLLSDPVLVSRPCTYVDFVVKKKTECDVKLIFEVSRDLVTQQLAQVLGGTYHRHGKPGMPDYLYAFMGRAKQLPLGGSGDRVTIDWGYVYLASMEEKAELTYDEEAGKLEWHLKIKEKKCETGLVLAYDDLLSINYFGEWRKAYWTKIYPTIQDAIGAAFADQEEVLEKAGKLDEEIQRVAEEIGGERYAYLCNLSYRQTVAAHKLICDEAGNMIFLSKENDSNGCIGTVDVSYPSMPLFLLYHTEYVKGMLRPVFRFAQCEAWEYDFAPHDVGRYPYAWGQVYGVKRKHVGNPYPKTAGRVRPPFYSYPAGNELYDLNKQMPVEECGNMLIMTAAVCLLEKSAEFAKPYQKLLKKWVQYLVDYGADPGEQLCTDDFAGHLAHNANLSVKAIMGIEAYSMLLGQMDDKKTQGKYHKIAQKMAVEWEKRADAKEHYMLAFGEPETWSLKYNLIWDRLFESGLFSDEVYKKEVSWYVKKTNRYGVPLDSRADYTKSDWICWCAAMAENQEQVKALLNPVADYLEYTPTRIPFGDWYDSVTGAYQQYMGRSVQGGIYMPMLKEKWG